MMKKSRILRKSANLLRTAAVAGFALFILFSCAPTKKSLTISYDDFPRIIDVPKPTPELAARFNALTVAELCSLKNKNRQFVRGYTTNNREFFKTEMKPLIEEHRDELSKLKPADLINALTLFTHEMYRNYFGADFYRWGGDLFDRDDPQIDGHRHEYKFGLDCSGFAVSGHEIAVEMGFLESKDALFSAKGFERYCHENQVPDKGGRNGTPNRFRLDTVDLDSLGQIVLIVEKGCPPTRKQMKSIQPGDLVGRSGHISVIVKINDEPYYLESGGRVVPRHGGLPVLAREAIAMFAEHGTVYIRRGLSE